MSRFTQRSIIVTGGGKGIGAAAVRAFHAEGGSVLILDADEDAASQLAQDLGPERAFAMAVDVTDEARVQACIEAARSRPAWC